MQEIQVSSLGQEDLLEKEMAMFPCRYMFIGGSNFAYWNGKSDLTFVCRI